MRCLMPDSLQSSRFSVSLLSYCFIHGPPLAMESYFSLCSLSFTCILFELIRLHQSFSGSCFGLSETPWLLLRFGALLGFFSSLESSWEAPTF